MRPQAAWNVITQQARAGGPTRCSTRSRISAAALFVNVIARISGGFAPTAASRCAMRRVNTRVFPEPAPAITSSGPSVVRTASRWAGFRSSRYVSGALTDTQPMVSGVADAPVRAQNTNPVDGEGERDARGREQPAAIA